MRTAVVGASGYTGLELVRILLRHPEAELVAATSEQRAGRAVAEEFPSLRGLTELRFEAADAKALADRIDVALTALPHAASAPLVAELRKQGVQVVDLSADFRFSDQGVYEEWYGPHKAPDWFGQAVYGLPELSREGLPGAQLIAAPGCYPTSVLIPLAPFLRQGLLETDVWVDSKSGVSGAGRKLADDFLFAELDGNCRAYKVGAHRHVPEMEEQAGRLAQDSVRVTFVPHLLPTIRGIVTSVFCRTRKSLSEAQARDILEQAYGHEPFVRVLPPGETPSLSGVRGSNYCDVTAFVDSRSGSLVLLSALDNLVKGAGGQAVQCLNIARGLEETAGLLEAPLVP